MPSEYLVDTNILIYHVHGSTICTEFLAGLIGQRNLHISILTKIEFLGWNKHTSEGFEKCKALIEPANIYPVDEAIAGKCIELRRHRQIKLADAVIAATAIVNGLSLATRNVEDFKGIEALALVNPFNINY
jgi:predicted nucleic acid-binding protein